MGDWLDAATATAHTSTPPSLRGALMQRFTYVESLKPPASPSTGTVITSVVQAGDSGTGRKCLAPNHTQRK